MFEIRVLTAFKAAVRDFFVVKNEQKFMIEQVHKNQCSKLSPYLTPIRNGKLKIMIYNLSSRVGFRGKGQFDIICLCVDMSRR